MQTKNINNSAAWNNYSDRGSPEVLRDLIAEAGLRINGDAPWDIQVRHPDVYRRVLAKGSLGFGEAYEDGLW